MAPPKKTATPPTPAASKAPKKSAAKKSEAAPVPAPVPEPAPVQEVAAAEPVVENKVEDEVSKSFTDLQQKLNELSSLFTTVKQDFKVLEKRYIRELRAACKANDKKKKSANAKPRSPSGFVKPTKISSELAVFLGKPDGTEMARTEVTREINKYIRANDLQDSSNGRKINPDDKLRGLLQVPKTDDLTYFNLQKYLSKHFPKAAVAAAPAN